MRVCLTLKCVSVLNAQMWISCLALVILSSHTHRSFCCPAHCNMLTCTSVLEVVSAVRGAPSVYDSSCVALMQ